MSRGIAVKQREVQTKNAARAAWVMECPYCAEPDLFASVYATPRDEGNPPKGVRVGPYLRHVPTLTSTFEWKPSIPGRTEARGKYWLDVYTEKDLAERLAGFTIHLLGTEVDQQPPMSPEPFFYEPIYRSTPGGKWQFGMYFALRATHKNSNIAIDVHWWPTHERKVALHGIPDTGATPQDLNFVNEALKLLRAETRGEPAKITRVKFIKALQKIGEEATQKAVAEELSVSDRTLREWQTREGANWGQLKQRYINTKVW